MHCALAGYIEMKSRLIYLTKYSGNIIKPSLHHYEKDNRSNIAFLFNYCISQTLHKFRLSSFQPNYRQQIKLKHFSTKWLKSDLNSIMRF